MNIINMDGKELLIIRIPTDASEFKTYHGYLYYVCDDNMEREIDLSVGRNTISDLNIISTISNITDEIIIEHLSNKQQIDNCESPKDILNKIISELKIDTTKNYLILKSI